MCDVWMFMMSKFCCVHIFWRCYWRTISPIFYKKKRVIFLNSLFAAADVNKWIKLWWDVWHLFSQFCSLYTFVLLFLRFVGWFLWEFFDWFQRKKNLFWGKSFLFFTRCLKTSSVFFAMETLKLKSRKNFDVTFL